MLVVVCGLILLWEWLERSREDAARFNKLERSLPFIFFVIGAYLLHLCDSKTSIICLVLGGMVILSSKIPLLRERTRALGWISLLGGTGYFILEWLFGIKEAVLTTLGRDATLTGRTEVWRELLALKTDPLIGTGFCSIWSDDYYLSQLPHWVSGSAHNGYLEMYIDGGLLGVIGLGILLIVTALRLNRNLGVQGDYSLVRFAVLIALIIGDPSESHFGRMSPLWFLFILVALEVRRQRVGESSEAPGLPARLQYAFTPSPSLSRG